MATTTATAAGIASIVSVLQSVLKCYQDFLTARNFPDDFAVCQVRAALLENSTATWAVAVGLQYESGESRDELLIKSPTKQNASLINGALQTIQHHLQKLNFELEQYTEGWEVSEVVVPDNATEAKQTSNQDTTKMKRFVNKLRRTAHREHDAQHPGTWKRTTWASIDKVFIEHALDNITAMVDRLNTDFPPVNQKSQLNSYYETIKDIGFSEADLEKIGAAAGDRVFKLVVNMIKAESAKGDRFDDFKVTGDGTVIIGDFYDKDWSGTGTIQPSRGDSFGNVSVNDRAVFNIGNNYGGKSPAQIRLEQMAAAEQNARHSSSSK